MYYLKKLGEKFEKGIEILDNVRTRRTNSQDLEKLKNYPAVDLWTLYPNAFSRIDLRTFVLEFLGRDINDAPEIESMIYKTLLAMRLYKPISVFCKIVWFEENLEEYYAISATLKFFTERSPSPNAIKEKKPDRTPNPPH